MSRGDLPIRASLIQRAWLRRTIRLSGEVDATVAYEARGLGVAFGADSVRIDGAVVPDLANHSPAGSPEYHRVLKFSLAGPAGDLPAQIEAHLTDGVILPTQLAALRLTVDGTVVYEERNGRVLGSGQDSLPLPAAAPAPDPDALPIPSEHPEAPDEER